jgi:iron-sulfur cluster assembly accessory protein
MTENIISFTDKAIEHITKALTRYPQGGFRLSTKKAGCTGYKYIPEILAAPKPGDQEFTTQQGLRVFIDPLCRKALEGTVVDLVNKGLGQKQLTFTNPNAVSECGCGESFNLKEDAHG